MKRLLQKLAPPDWNKRILDFADFKEFCRERNIRVFEVGMPRQGVHISLAGEPIIFINSRLDRLTKLRVAWHEFGHHLLHIPGIQYFDGGTRTCRQADAFAVCALVPRSLIEKPLPELLDDYPPELLKLRFSLLKRYRF